MGVQNFLKHVVGSYLRNTDNFNQNLSAWSFLEIDYGKFVFKKVN